MSEFHFYHPIEVRYGDLDPQGHVNNSRYLTYMEQARIQYIHQLGLWEGDSFMDIGIILADVHITFLAPIQFKQVVRVGVHTVKMGIKSITMEYQLEDAHSLAELARGSSVVVAYDYRNSQTIPIPERWRQVISQFEGALLAPASHSGS